MIAPGSKIEIHYPTSTHVRWLGQVPRTRREIEVVRVRDLLSEPLTLDEFLRRPFVHRSRWLALAKDYGLREWRQFYVGSSQEFQAPGTMRLAIYQPGEGKPSQLLGREFLPTVHDRKLMIRLIRRWKSQDHGELQLRVCCDDLRLIR